MAERATSERTVGPLVLVAEDDPETRQFYVALLQGAGYRIAQAHNGLQALEKAVELLPDLVLTDLAIPGIDGFELSARLHADQRTQAIPVLAVTGRDFADVAQRSDRAGFRMLLRKPCDPDDLLREVARLLAADSGRSPKPADGAAGA